MMAKKKVYLGLSGGVDSSVAAALLLEQGYDVVPVFLKCWEGSDFEGSCPWEDDQKMAYEVAKILGIADTFQSWNFSQEFFENVVRYLVDEAKEGRTGNPDVVCNRTIKFGAFLERALAEGADFVATGHYARLRCPRACGYHIRATHSTTAQGRPEPDRGASGSRSQRPDPARAGEGLPQEMHQLIRPLCETKNDQTYFLWQLNQKQLSRTLFPIGEFECKEAVRAQARRRGLPSAERKSTRGICFVGKAGQAEFLSKFLPEAPGNVKTSSGTIVGRHQGVSFYTIGQRQGIGVLGGGGPYYVLEKNEERNELIVAPPAEVPALWKKEAIIGNMNWISGLAPALPFDSSAFIRHPQPDVVSCLVEPSRQALGDQLLVRFSEPQWAPTPGQSVVLYDGKIVLGGGVIEG